MKNKTINAFTKFNAGLLLLAMIIGLIIAVNIDKKNEETKDEIECNYLAWVFLRCEYKKAVQAETEPSPPKDKEAEKEKIEKNTTTKVQKNTQDNKHEDQKQEGDTQNIVANNNTKSDDPVSDEKTLKNGDNKSDKIAEIISSDEQKIDQLNLILELLKHTRQQIKDNQEFIKKTCQSLEAFEKLFKEDKKTNNPNKEIIKFCKNN